MPDDARNLFDKPELAVAFIGVYAQVQTSWAVLILAFLAGLLAEMAVLSQLLFPLGIFPLAIYEILILALCYSIHRFLVATSIVYKAKKLFKEKHGEPIGWESAIYEPFLFELDGKIKRWVQPSIFVITFILFEFSLISFLT